jgi:hypothetical protein
MNFFSDAGIMEIDIYHALACYLMMGGGNSRMTPGHGNHWIFPDLARNSDTAAGMMTKYVREGMAACDDASIAGMSANYEGTSLRYCIFDCDRYRT